MTGKYTICDQCKRKSETVDGAVYGLQGHAFGWITVSRAYSASGDKVSAGTYHFCDDKCLTEWIKAKPSNDEPRNAGL